MAGAKQESDWSEIGKKLSGSIKSKLKEWLKEEEKK